jgi:hypothetical protein
MDPERFEQLGLTAIRWAYQAHRLYIAAQAFAGPQAEAMRNAFSRSPGTVRTIKELEHIQYVRAYTDAANLLYGLAIENAYKTRQIVDGTITIKNGKFVGMRSDHNILEMVRSYRIDLNEDEIDVLRSMTFTTVSMGKYPIAKSAEAQKSFTGRTYGAESVAPLTKRVALELLKESPYTAIFVEGRLSGVDDTG